jgi:hypothetical protein
MATVLDPSEPDVRAAAESAREILTRLGARPFLERLDAALAGTGMAGAIIVASGAARDRVQRRGARAPAVESRGT